MANRCGVLMLLIIFLISGAALAVEEDSQRMVIKLGSDDTGESLKIDNVDWPDWVDQKIQAVNDSTGVFCVDVYNGPTEQDIVNWLEKQEKVSILNFHFLDMLFDASLNVARMQNVARLMTDKGLERNAYRYVPLRDKDNAFVEIYFEGYPESAKGRRDTTHVSRVDTLYVVGSTKNLLVGGESTVVSDGKPVTVPIFSLEFPGKNHMLSLTGGYLPTGGTDQKFFAESGIYFPNGGKLGYMARVIYASESIETFGSYIQQGFGPTAGLMWCEKSYRIHLTVGIQYFDRLNQDRRVEPTINLGVRLNILTF